MNTDEPLVQLEYDQAQELQIHNHQQPNEQSSSSSRTVHALIEQSSPSTTTTTVGQKQQQTTSIINNTSKDFSIVSTAADDRHSIISISSSSTTEEACLIPEVCFDNINLDSSASRESQPLLGGRDQIDHLPCNYFPGNWFRLGISLHIAHVTR